MRENFEGRKQAPEPGSFMNSKGTTLHVNYGHQKGKQQSLNTKRVKEKK